MIAWAFFGASWLFASASFAAKTESKAVLYQLIYIMLACLQGISFLGMTMLVRHAVCFSGGLVACRVACNSDEELRRGGGVC
jgi:hypothetical protein